MRKIFSLLNIRQDEIKTATLLTGIMLFIAIGYTLGGTGIEALYFARYGTDLLPYLYMGLGILSLFTSLAITGLLARLKRERMYVLIPFLAMIFLIVAWVLLFGDSKFIFPALWLEKEALNTITSMIAWNTAGAVCNSRQAKRLFPLFNAARILGSVFGGLGTGLLVDFIGTQNLVLVWALSMLIVFGMARMLMGSQSQITEINSKRRVKRSTSSIINEMQKGWVHVRNSPLLRWISVAAILFSILYFSIALPFSKSITEQYPNENELASFLGLFNGLSTAAAFLTSVFFANRLYARFGIMNIILALPLIYLFGFGSLILFNVFSVIVIFRFIQMLWLSGMADAAYQTMFSAVPPEKRDQVNAFLNGVPEQAGVFLAGIILIVGEQAFTSQQLYSIGLVVAIATTLIIWRASSAYRNELVNSLREGRPTIFGGRATTYDTTSLQVAIENLKHTDPIVRRVSAEMLSEMNQPQVLISALQDEDAEVRIASLKGLTKHTPAMLEVAALLSDVEPAVRAQAIHTLWHLSPHPLGLHIFLEPNLQDENVHVQMEAAFGLLKVKDHLKARELIRFKCVHGTNQERIHALNIMAELGDKESYALIAEQLMDSNASIRRAAALALASCGEDAIPTLVQHLTDEDSSVRQGIAQGLAKIGNVSTTHVIHVLNEYQYTDGALLTLSYLPVNKYQKEIKSFVDKKIKSALRYDKLARTVNIKNERFSLLQDSLHARASQDGIHVLHALSLLNDRESIQTAITNLKSKSATQRANALETLESIRNSRLIKPILQLWEVSESEPSLDAQIDYTHDFLGELMDDEDEWIQSCAKFAAKDDVQSEEYKGEKMDTRTSLSVMDRVLLLRRVPLFVDLSPADLQQVAILSSEHHAEASEVIFEQGEIGEEMYVIVHGEVQVMFRQNDKVEKEIARRKVGDVVGEMSIISGEPRIASLIAVEETHFLCLDKKSFEGLIRERPEVGLAVMRVLCQRLKEAAM